MSYSLTMGGFFGFFCVCVSDFFFFFWWAFVLFLFFLIIVHAELLFSKCFSRAKSDDMNGNLTITKCKQSLKFILSFEGSIFVMFLS